MAARFSRKVPGVSTNRLTPEHGTRLAALAAAAGLAALPIAGAEAREPAVEELGGNRYRLSVSLRTDSQPGEYAEAQDDLREAAQRHCEGRGRAVAEGPVEVGSAPRGRTSLTLQFHCAGSESNPPVAG